MTIRPLPPLFELFEGKPPTEARPYVAPEAQSAPLAAATLQPDEPDDDGGWQEVPAARFLSWSPAMQNAYCAARDLDSAECSDSAEWIRFYLDRRKLYLETK